MAVTFYSGFKDKFHALDFLTDNVFTGFQIKNKICIALKGDHELEEFSFLRNKKFFETKKIEFLCLKNLTTITDKFEGEFDEIHIFSDKIGDLPESLNDNTFVYTLKSDEAINNASRELYTNLKNKGVNVLHEAI